MFTYDYTIGFSDVDAAGLVYYPRFFHFCHLALQTFFHDQGPVDYPELIYERRLGLPIVKVEADYKSPLQFGDAIEIQLGIEAIGNASVRTRYVFVNKKDATVCFLARVTTVCTDLNSKKSVAIPEDIKDFLTRHQILGS